MHTKKCVFLSAWQHSCCLVMLLFVSVIVHVIDCSVWRT